MVKWLFWLVSVLLTNELLPVLVLAPPTGPKSFRGPVPAVKGLDCDQVNSVLVVRNHHFHRSLRSGDTVANGDVSPIGFNT